MFNHEIGTEVEVDGTAYFRTAEGASGHAVFGPYRVFQPGDYAVEFALRAADERTYVGDDTCAVVDVTTNSGKLTFAREEIPTGRFGNGSLFPYLQFHLAEPQLLEFRVEVTGRAPILIAGFRRVVSLPSATTDAAAILADSRFPENVETPFFAQNHLELRRLYEAGAVVRIENGDVAVRISDVWLNARVSDDMRFIREVLKENAYNFLTSRECCVIDIGMNVGLATLFFAKKDFVKEVHSFEPFTETYERAVANIRLNTELEHKISAYNFGLADWNDDVTVMINDLSDSGAISIRGVESGREVQISVRSADSTLRPIINAAKRNGLDVVAKIDCEGSEFPIFESLEASGLLEEVSVIMLEWHRGVGVKTQHDLIRPLLARDFVVFDLTPEEGNGFFYAVRKGA